MNRRQFIKRSGLMMLSSAALILSSGCVAPRVSPAVFEKKSQPWQCGNCGHLTRSDEDLTDTRCPRCMRKGFFKKITEKELQQNLEE